MKTDQIVEAILNEAPDALPLDPNDHNAKHVDQVREAVKNLGVAAARASDAASDINRSLNGMGRLQNLIKFHADARYLKSFDEPSAAAHIAKLDPSAILGYAHEMGKIAEALEKFVTPVERIAEFVREKRI